MTSPRAAVSSFLQHIPGRDGLPFLGDTLAFVRDPYGWTERAHRKYGPVVRSNMFFEASVSVADPDFAERFLIDKDQNFSSQLGWANVFERFFGGGLMLRDFDVHRLHRRIMQVAFKRDALSGYWATMRPILERGIAKTTTLGYPWIKQMTLDAAGAIFLGLEGEADLRRVNQLFVDTMLAASAALRFDWPGTTFARGLKARRELDAWVAELIPQRRGGSQRDMLTILCNTTTEEGERFSDREIIDHIIFLLLAAHDTTTSALTNLMLELGRRPEWQTRLRQQSQAIGALDEEAIPKLSLVYDCFREVLRLYPPVRAIPRRALRELEVNGHRIPANAQMWLNVERIQRDPKIYTNPDDFDPERFADGRAEHKRHRFGWIPFGAGAHTCLGLQFAELQVKMFMHLLLTQYEWSVEAGPMQYLPFIKPKNDLPVQLKRLAA